MSNTLSITDVFTPAASGVGSNPALTPKSGTWLAILLQIAQAVGLPTTAWQPGGPERTILALTAVAFAQEDSTVSLMAQGGFLQFAASGTVTSVSVTGETVTAYVTPDPSIPSQNPTGAPGWLDILAQSVYGVQRLEAGYASGQLAIANTTSGAAGPYSPGSYHVANPLTNATYSNASTLSIPSSAIGGTGGIITACTTGGLTTCLTQSPHGLAVGTIVYLAGLSGVTFPAGAFGTVTAVPSSTTLQVGVTSTGTWTAGGSVYVCTIADFAADVVGTGSNAAPSTVTATVTQATGIATTNISAWSAANWESNPALANRCTLKLGALSPNGPSEAYEYLALTAAQILAAKSPPVTLTNGPIIQAETFGLPASGSATTVVASSSPASTTLGQAVTPGCVGLAIATATATSPIVFTTDSAHGLNTGDTATIQAVVGLLGANGTWTITVLSGTSFSANGSVGTGDYATGTGVVDGGDLGQLDALLQSMAVPDGVTALTQSALALPVAISATVVVPQAYVATYRAAVVPALVAYLLTLDIGGFVAPGTTTGVVPYSAVEGALSDVGVLTVGATSYVRQISGLTVNAGTSDVPYPTQQYQAVLVTPTITVVGV